jgi:hypothetical protein
MSRGPQNFKQADVVKAIKAAQKAGLPVARVEISPDGRIVVIAGRPARIRMSLPPTNGTPSDEAPQSPTCARVPEPTRHHGLLSPQAGTTQDQWRSMSRRWTRRRPSPSSAPAAPFPARSTPLSCHITRARHSPKASPRALRATAALS